MDQKELSPEDIIEFRKSYYQQIDYSYWQERLFQAWRRYNKLKRSDNKEKYIVEIYSIYIQVTEILLINMHSMSVPPDRFLSSLAIDNYEIRDFASQVLKNDRFVDGFTDNFVYKIRGEKQPDRKEMGRDKNILKECIKDYLDNYNFLNSYKHGFRVHSLHGNNYIAIGLSPTSMHKVVEGDSQITYYDMKKVKGRLKSISEVSITFNHMRIFGKTLYLIIYLMNVRLSQLAALGVKKKVKHPVFYIYDEKNWHDSFGQSRFVSELITFVSKEPQPTKKERAS
jgi:hypothetical protein